MQRLTKGPLHTLQKLEETSVELRESDDGQFKQQQRLAYLQKAVQNLKAKRDQLKKDLKSTPWKVLRNSVLQESDDGQLIASTDGAAKFHDAILPAINTAQRVKAQHVLTHTYRLRGSSVATVTNAKHKCIRVCWDSFHKGQYYEPYYMELQSSNKPNGGSNNLTIAHHSLPYFVPLEELKEGLNEDLPEFIGNVRLYLNAFVCRRQQAFELQNKHNVILVGEVQASVAFDVMTFDLKLTNQDTPCIASITAIYKDLLHVQPSRVDVSVEDDTLSRSAKRKLCNQLKTLVTTHPIPDAVDEML